MTNTEFRLPKPKDLYRGLLISLGWATNFTPGVEIHCTTLFLDTLRASGIDPDSVPEGLLTPPEGQKCKTLTCWRVFLHSFRYLREKTFQGEPQPRGVQERRSYWALTEWGAQYAQNLLNWDRSLLLTLGWQTEFQAGVGINPESLFFDTIRGLGVDLATIPLEELYPTENRTSNAGTYWGYFLDSFEFQLKGTLLGEKGPRVSQCENLWALTPQGVESVNAQQLPEAEAKHIAQIFSSRECTDTRNDPGAQNLTRDWVENEWPKMADKVIHSLYADPKLSKSVTMDFIRDHAQTWIMRALKNNSLYRDLSAGKRIPPSKVALFIKNSALSEIRTWGKDASCVALRGAMSATSRKQMEANHSKLAQGEQFVGFSSGRLHQKIEAYRYQFDDDYNFLEIEFKGGDLSEEMDSQIAILDGLRRISMEVGRQLNRIPQEQTMDIVSLCWRDDMTIPEVSSLYQIPEADVKKLLKDVRRVCTRKFGNREKLLSPPKPELPYLHS